MTAPPRRAAASKLHESGLPQKAAEHRDAAGARASDFTTQVRLARGGGMQPLGGPA